MNFSLLHLKEILGSCEQRGEYAGIVNNIAALEEAKPGDLSFLANTKYKSKVAGCKASVILIPKTYEGAPQPNQVFLVFEDPSFALGSFFPLLEKSFCLPPFLLSILLP